MSNLKEKLIQRLEEQKKNRVIGKTLKDLPYPKTLKNCIPAAKQLIDWLMKGKRGLIIGDYDADGIIATSVLMQFFEDIGFTRSVIDFKIPSRKEHGYGVSPILVDYAIENNFDFIVTVDNGIAAYEAIEKAKKAGLGVIVTDHHTAPEKLPNADWIVNPKQPGETFEFINISGATVAWYMVAAMREILNAQIDLRKYLDLVAITVVSDVMPLTDINLAILNYGLKQMRNRTRFLYQLLWNNWTAPVLNSIDIAFSLVPRINAIGRIDDANIAVEMFISKSQEKIKQIYDQMNEINETRKMMSRQYILEAEASLEDINIEEDSIIIVKNANFHEGIVGIIAGKLAEKYKKPAFVFSWNEKKQLWKGSGRTTGDIWLYDLTLEVSEHIFGFGGHKGAVGVAVKDEKWNNFVKAMKKAIKKYKPEDFIDKNNEPIECTLSDINHEIIEILDKYEPYGHENPKPVFTTSGVKAYIEREFKGGLHFKCNLFDGQKTHTALFFNVEREKFIQSIQKPISIEYSLNKAYNPNTGLVNIELFSTIKENNNG